MLIKPIYEFLLWDNCKNNCTFCFQRNSPRIFSLIKKEKALNATISFIDSTSFKKGSHVLIVGGEIFDSPECNNILDTFFKEIVIRMNDTVIDLLYINTNLIYTDLTGLYNVINLLKNNNLLHRLKFTTSYDLAGRFRTDEYKNLMLNNLRKLKEDYSEINIVVNTILTKPTCEAILNDNFNIKTFMQEYKCYINLVPYIIYNQDLSTSRGNIIKTLNKVNIENDGYIKGYISNFDLPQNKLLYVYKNNKFEFCSCDLDECGHSINFKRYSIKNSCFVCDLKEFFLND